MAAAKQFSEKFGSSDTSGQLVFQNPSNWLKAGDHGIMVEGIYEGTLPPDAFGKVNYKFTATNNGVTYDKTGSEREFGPGATVILNSSSNLIARMKDVEVGTEVSIMYNGQNKLTSGRFKEKMAHSYSLKRQ